MKSGVMSFDKNLSAFLNYVLSTHLKYGGRYRITSFRNVGKYPIFNTAPNHTRDFYKNVLRVRTSTVMHRDILILSDNATTISLDIVTLIRVE
jgi:hypothetical protein